MRELALYKNCIIIITLQAEEINYNLRLFNDALFRQSTFEVVSFKTIHCDFLYVISSQYMYEYMN